MSKQLRLPTILLVTISPSVRAWAKKHLDQDFFLIMAEKGYQALDALNASLNFIIVDANLAEEDPLALCQALSQIAKKKLIPIFLMTGRLKKSYRDQAKQCGVSDFLSDQLDLEELRSRIQTVQKAENAREKIADLGSAIHFPKGTPSLKNKLVLNEAALRLLADAKKKGTPVALLLLRIDRFEALVKKEQVLKNLEQFLQQYLRPNDVLTPSTEGRLILLLANLKLEDARKVAERLHEKVQQQTLCEQKITVSIAVSPLEPTEKGFSKMIDTAIKSFRTHSETNLIISLDQENL